MLLVGCLIFVSCLLVFVGRCAWCIVLFSVCRFLFVVQGSLLVVRCWVFGIWSVVVVAFVCCLVCECPSVVCCVCCLLCVVRVACCLLL